jgi:hypothetical protein
MARLGVLDDEDHSEQVVGYHLRLVVRASSNTSAQQKNDKHDDHNDHYRPDTDVHGLVPPLVLANGAS